MKKHSTLVPIIHPLFIQCCHYVHHDEFWKEVFENMAYNKCPFGVFIHNNTMCCTVKGKEFSYALRSHNIEQTTNDIIDLLRSKTLILSQYDHVQQRLKLQKAFDTYFDGLTSWNDIKKQSMRVNLLQRYVLHQSAHYKYSMAFTRRFFSLLFVGLQFRMIVSRHIHYSHGRIRHIDGLECLPGMVVCARHIIVPAPPSPPFHVDTDKVIRFVSKQPIRISSMWVKYVASLS
jgi:hypothetical protein